MEKFYEAPSIRLLMLSTMDVITASDAEAEWNAMWNDGELPEEDFE